MSALSFAAGDRVAEKPRPGDHVFSDRTANLSAIRRYASSSRTGRVVGTLDKRSANGARIRYVEVIWDGRQSPSLHAVSRLSVLDAER
jgi:hypothetical protein